MRKLWIRGVLRVLRWISWSSLAGYAIFTINYLEVAARRDRLGLPLGVTQIVFSLTELFAVFCCAIAVDRGFSLGEKSFDEPD
jgi:hypothetical protein